MITISNCGTEENPIARISDNLTNIAEVDFLKDSNKYKYIVLQTITMHQTGVTFNDINMIARYIGDDVYPISKNKQEELTKKLIDFEKEFASKGIDK